MIVVALWSNFAVTTGRALFSDGKQYDFYLRENGQYRFFTSRDPSAQQSAAFGYAERLGYAFWAQRRTEAIKTIVPSVVRGAYGTAVVEDGVFITAP